MWISPWPKWTPRGFVMPLNTCGACLYFGEHPAMPGSREVGQCYGMPPLTMLLPGAAAPKGIVRAGQQQVMASLSSVRPAIQAVDRGCSLFHPVHTN